MRKILLILLLFPVFAFAGTVTRYQSYTTNSQVTSDNLNGNFNNIINEVNGGLDNDNIDSSKFRFLEKLGALPAYGSEGRVVYNSGNKTLNVDTGSSWSNYYPYNPASVAITGGTVAGTTITGATITGGSISGITDLSVPDGGTGKSSWTQYLIPYADTITSFSQIPIGSLGQVLTSNGAGSAPSFQALTAVSTPVFSFSGTFTNNTTAYVFVAYALFKKISGISTVTINALLSNSVPTHSTYCRIIIDSLTALEINSNSEGAFVIKSGSINVSSLTNNTVYQVSFEIQNDSGTDIAGLRAVTAIGS